MALIHSQREAGAISLIWRFFSRQRFSQRFFQTCLKFFFWFSYRGLSWCKNTNDIFFFRLNLLCDCECELKITLRSIWVSGKNKWRCELRRHKIWRAVIRRWIMIGQSDKDPCMDKKKSYYFSWAYWLTGKGGGGQAWSVEETLKILAPLIQNGHIVIISRRPASVFDQSSIRRESWGVRSHCLLYVSLLRKPRVISTLKRADKQIDRHTLIPELHLSLISPWG